MAPDRFAPPLDPAVRAERERIARDLHDTVLQDLLAVGIMLASDLDREPDTVRRDRDAALASQLERAVSKLRETVGHLDPPIRGVDLEQELGSLMVQTARLLGFAPSLHLTGPLDELDPRLAGHVAAVLQECLSNVARHAHATSVAVAIEVTETHVAVEVTDDGCGITGDAATQGHGLRNLHTRAVDCGGRLVLTPGETHRGLSVGWYADRSTGRGRSATPGA